MWCLELKVIIRNLEKNDASSVLNFYKERRLLPQDSYKYQPYTENDFRRLAFEEGPFGEKLDSSGFFLSFSNDKLIGIARTHIASESSDGEKGGFISPEWPWSSMGLAVLPQYRRKGIGTMLLEKCFDYLRRNGATYAQTSFDVRCVSRAKFFSAHSFNPWGLSIVYMIRDLHVSLPAPILPEGYSFKRFEMGEEKELVDSANEVFRDEWLFKPRSIAGFVNFYEKNPDFDPSGFFSIIHRQKIVGLAWNLISKNYVENLGKKAGFLEVLGIDHEQRRKGLGTALVLKILAWHKNKGMNYVYLNTHSETAIKLYEKCGFKIASRWKILRKQL